MSGHDDTDRPSAAEVSQLLRDYRQMLADAGGWASRIPRDHLAAWEQRKRDLLARIEAHTAQVGRDDGDSKNIGEDDECGWSL